MPEPIKNEEDVNREQSLCLYKVPGINKLNRCSNCPGASRSPLQHRRCPLDVGEPNIFRAPADPVNLSGASSSGKGREPETELLTNQAQELSLADSSASGSCSAVTSGVPSQEDVVSKRKLENHQMYILGREFQDLSAQEWTINKPPRPFVDGSPDVHLNKRLRQMMRISETELMQSPEQQMTQYSEQQMMQIREHQMMQSNPEENHSAGRASTSRTIASIPGFSMDIDVGVYCCPYSMELEEPK